MCFQLTLNVWLYFLNMNRLYSQDREVWFKQYLKTLSLFMVDLIQDPIRRKLSQGKNTIKCFFFHDCRRENTTLIMPSSDVFITCSLIFLNEEGVRTNKMKMSYFS